MKKIHRALQKGPNKWEKKTGWRFDTEDAISLAILVVIAGFVLIRALID